MTPTPHPLEGVQGPVSGFITSAQQPQQQQQQQQQHPQQMQLQQLENMGGGGPRAGSISLGILIEFIVQRTYHELTVLTELLPLKSDMERKIEIYNFSARTRQLFIRLLALVKWANSASKVDRSAHIMSFLEKQSLLFVDTADMLSRMARETLVHARLPNFHIPAAVEVLTTGTYARLPACIRERIVPPDPITISEKKQTLLRLNQVIQHRLVIGNLLPQMRKFKIESGRVTFHVEHEFEVSLTVMGDGNNVPWRLLEIDILVEDKETGNGKALVHTLQVNYIHQLIQARLVDNQNALTEVYNCLHYFCQSLQLEVLYTQTLRLMMDRLDDNIHVDEYIAGSKLTISYWRELTNKDPKSEFGYRLTIQTDPHDGARPLAVFHLPSIGVKESSEVADRAIRSELLSVERLLVHTVYIRSLSRLSDIKSEFQSFLKDVDYHLQGTPAILTVPVLNPCLRAEQIHITVDTHTGMLRCQVPKHLDCPIIPDLQTALNNDPLKLSIYVSELRYWITKQRCEKTLQHLPASSHSRLPILPVSPDHPLSKIGRHRHYVKLNRHPNIILIVELNEKSTNKCEMEYTFYLVSVKPASIDEEQNVTDGVETETPKKYYKILNLIQFDTFAITHGPGTYVDECFLNKRKSSTLDQTGGPSPAKQQKAIYPAYFIPELAHVVAMCDEKLPFVALAAEFIKRKIPHSGLQIEANATSLVLKLLTLPQPERPQQTPPPAPPQPSQQQQQQPQQGAPTSTETTNTNNNKDNITKNFSIPIIDATIWDALLKRLLSVTIRYQVNKTHFCQLWVVELIFYGSPLQSLYQREQGLRRAVIFQYDLTEPVAQTVDNLLRDWSKIVYLYSLVHEFAEQFKNEKSNLPNFISIKSYSYTNLVIGYGPDKEVNMDIFWCPTSKEFKMISSGGLSAINAHSMMREQLQYHLNKYYSLSQIFHILHETYQPLSSIARLPIIPQLGIPRPHIPVLTFCIIPQTPTLVRIAYQANYCLEIRLRGGGLVSIRDGAYSRFDRSNVVDEFSPTQGLRSFLTKYVDESAVYRRRSQSEDDNPPSPMIALEDQQGGPLSVGGGGGGSIGGGGGAGGSSPFIPGGLRAPQSPRDAGLRFPASITPPSTSNPHTPASPHPQIASQQGGHPNFNMTSPPAPHMPHPSPSGANLMPASPLNTQPSPMAHSPINYMPPAQHTLDGSPFALSPAAASNWPGSPNMPRPSPRPGQSPEHKSQTQAGGISRVLPARSWAGAIPTLLTHEALETLCRPTVHPQKEIPGPEMAPLERFLGCVSIRRQLQRFIQSEETLSILATNEPGVIHFKTDGLQCQAFVNPIHMQSLHLKITPIGPEPKFTMDDVQVLEQFFDNRVASPPYRPSLLHGFARILTVPHPVFRDFIQIMRLELAPDQLPGMKWNIQLCMRVPPSATPIVPVGHAAIHTCRARILFFLQFTRIQYMPAVDWKDTATIVLPFIYDAVTNSTQLAEKREPTTSVAATAATHQLRRFAEYNVPNNECSLFPSVRDLLLNLTLPNEPQQPQQSQPQQQQQQPSSLQAQIIPSSPVTVGSSPSPMMHSPMQNIVQGGPQQQPHPPPPPPPQSSSSTSTQQQNYGMAPSQQGPN